MRHDRSDRVENRPPAAVTAGGQATRGFTLVELLVTTVIIMTLSMLFLSGMAVARKRVRIDATRNTIRKIHEIVMPQYESYLRRRVPLPAGLTSSVVMARERLQRLRMLALYEMPDSWGNVLDGPAAGTALLTGSNAFLVTGPVLAYAATKAALGAPVVSGSNGSAECLYMIASRGPGEPDVMGQFRTDEIGDTDKNGAPEFIDAWGRPIGFIRWAAGFSAASPVQKADAANYHDPMDPMRVDTNGYALIPLIVSAGPDGLPGLTFSGTAGWPSPASLPSVVNAFGTPDGTGAHLDNVTNHDLVKK